MSLSSAKAKLDAQGGDPVTGYISKTDHQESYDELVDDTALTGATTAEAITVSGAAVAGTLNGRDPDDLAKGPASATDNALVRFDGTDGKTVQNSGITVDDSGNVTTDLTVSKASAAVRVNASSGSAAIYFDRVAGATGNFVFRTGVSNRWVISATGDAESGSNVGTDFALLAYSDAGSFINTPLRVTRKTGLITLGSVGATAGMEWGSGGPRVMSGTGSPEGVVTAPVGSQWIDTAATTGAVAWRKVTGAGSSGWVVEYGDTGNRNMVASLTNSWTASTALLRRVGRVCTLQFTALAGGGASADGFLAVPSGFGRTSGAIRYAITDGLSTTYIAHGGSSFDAPRATVASSSSSITWITNDPWPTSLPGS